MALSQRSQLGSFEISGLLGVGGMGEVYRVRDTKHAAGRPPMLHSARFMPNRTRKPVVTRSHRPIRDKEPTTLRLAPIAKSRGFYNIPPVPFSPTGLGASATFL